MDLNNRKGEAAFVLVALMMGIFFFMIAMVFIDPMKDVITEVRAADQLNCTSTALTDGEKSTCLIVDLIMPMFIGVVLATAAGIIGARFIIG